MANFYKDNPDIKLNLERIDLHRLADLIEGDYNSVHDSDIAPENSADAVENYLKICQIAGELAGGPIAERSAKIDEEGNVCCDGDVFYHELVKKNLEDFRKAQLLGISIPREYGGLNMPQIVKVVVLEIISRADASLMNLVGLQDIGETIAEFGSDEQKNTYIPPLANGAATGAMILTEPDSGSDLQSVRLKATYSGDDNSAVWHLNGVKRFITNGNGDILLVMARSEEGTKDGRGLSLFVCKKQESIQVRRIENKLGIHGSPTCEMTFSNATAYLIGKRKFGLIKYVMSLMNGARIGIAAQSLGIAEASYRLAHEYAETRVQFGKTIVEIPAVYEMLSDMRLNIEAGRLLLYETAKIVDFQKALTKRIEVKRENGVNVEPSEKQNAKYYDRFAVVLTPFSKYFNAEMCNRTAYDGIQVMGGSGYMKDYPMERYYRDARITNIYEGTSQLQVVAAIGGILGGVLEKEFDKFKELQFGATLRSPADDVKTMLSSFAAAVQSVKDKKDHEYTDFVAERIVKMALDIFISTLFLDAAKTNERKAQLAQIWISKAKVSVNNNSTFILSDERNIIDNHSEIIA